MRRLELSDFKKEYLATGYYYSYKTDKNEVCLEPCLNGFDVAIYDLSQNLIGAKTCTNMTISSIFNTSIQVHSAFIRAVDIASKQLYMLEEGSAE